MTTAENAKLARLRHEIIRRAHAGLDAWTLRTETLSLLRRLMPIDAVWWALADPDTLLFTRGLIDNVPSTATPLFLQNELLQDDVNKFTQLARGPRAVCTLYEATEGRPERSSRFRDILEPNRMGDEMRVALRDARHAWGFMCLHREAGGREFSSTEQDWLRQIGPHLAAGLRHSLLLERAGGARGVDGAGRVESAPGVLIVTADLERVSISESAERWLADLDDWRDLDARALPIASVVSHLIAIENGTSLSPDPPRLRVRTSSGRWLTMSASRLAQTSGPDQIAVIVEPSRAEDVVPLVLAAYGLTESETKVARCVLHGFSNKEVAEELAITPLTVQQHLKGVFEKANVHSRGELLARLQAQYRQ